MVSEKKFWNRSRKLLITSLFGMALIAPPSFCKDFPTCPDSKIVTTSQNEASNQKKVIENYSLDYGTNVYFLGFKIISCKLKFDLKKVEEEGLVKSIMAISGRHSDSYQGHISTEVTEDSERYSYYFRHKKRVEQEEAVFYKDKIKIVRDGLENIIYNEGFVGLQSVMKHLLTEDLEQGKTFNFKTYFKKNKYDLSFSVGGKGTVKIGNHEVEAYHVLLESKAIDSGKNKNFYLWVTEDEPYNRIVKASFEPSVLTKAHIILDLKN